MSARDIILAATGYVPQLVETTYTASGTATWPAGVPVTLHGIGGPRTSSTTGYTPGAYPTASAYLTGKVTNLGHTGNYLLPCTISGYPSSVDLVGTGLMGTVLTFSYPGQLVQDSNDASFYQFFSADSVVLAINTVTSGAGYAIGSYLGSFSVAGGLNMDDPILGGGRAGGGIQFTNPILSYSDGPVATLIVNGVTKTFPGQTAGGANTFTDFASVATGATVSGALVIPAGGSIKVSYTI